MRARKLGKISCCPICDPHSNRELFRQYQGTFSRQQRTVTVLVSSPPRRRFPPLPRARLRVQCAYGRRVDFVMLAICSLYPLQQTSPGPVAMSQKCQKWTSWTSAAALLSRPALNLGVDGMTRPELIASLVQCQSHRHVAPVGTTQGSVVALL